MILTSFILILAGLSLITAGILLSTLHIAGAGKWPGCRPNTWPARLKRSAFLTGGGALLTLLGILAGYGI
jgi:hypothetical protein